jgi:hypothetical protein
MPTVIAMISRICKKTDPEQRTPGDATQSGRKTYRTEILLAWNATWQASSAAHDGLPFLKSAGQVNILTVRQTREHSAALDTEGHELSASLARHGVKPVVVHVDQTNGSMGEEVSFQAHINGCNLIEMGAFSHSRLLDLFLVMRPDICWMMQICRCCS